jgi:hypothetical protein
MHSYKINPDTDKSDFVNELMEKLNGTTVEDKIYLGKYFDGLMGLIDHEEVIKSYMRTTFIQRKKTKIR